MFIHKSLIKRIQSIAYHCQAGVTNSFSGLIWWSHCQYRCHWVVTKIRIQQGQHPMNSSPIWKPLVRVLQCHHLLESRCFFAKRCDHFVNVDIKSTRPYKTRVSNCMHSLWLYGTSLLCSKKGWMSKLSSNFFWVGGIPRPYGSKDEWKTKFLESHLFPTKLEKVESSKHRIVSSIESPCRWNISKWYLYLVPCSTIVSKLKTASIVVSSSLHLHYG